jgi:hypothetical protein
VPHPAGERLPPRLQLEVVELRDPVSVGHLDQLQVAADLLEPSQCLLHVLLLDHCRHLNPHPCRSLRDNGIPEPVTKTPSRARRVELQDENGDEAEGRRQHHRLHWRVHAPLLILVPHGEISSRCLRLPLPDRLPWLSPSSPTGRAVTAQGHPRAIFKRAVKRGNIVLAEATARELGKLSLEEALGLSFLYAEKEPIKFERAALRWLARYVTEGKAVSLLKAQLALSALAELRVGERDSEAPD